MNWRRLSWIGLGAVGLGVAIGGAWILFLPPASTPTAEPPITKQEADATLTALKPPKRQRPLIAIVGINDATEATDYLLPYGVLRRSDVADLVPLATEPGPMKLYPALKVEPQATVAEFDAQHPEGADYVIVPAMSRDDDPAALEWLRSQAAKDAIIIGVCAGAKVVAEAGLLDGKRATTHWYSVAELGDKHPSIRYVADRRLVVDQGVATTTGVTASMPMSLTLIEAIAGRDKAKAVGREIGRPEHGRFLEPRAARPGAHVRRRRGLTCPGGGRLVADLPITRLDVLPHRPCDADPQRHPNCPRSGHRELAGEASASGDRGSATGKSLGRSPSGDRRPLRNANGRLRRHATRISAARRVAMITKEAEDLLEAVLDSPSSAAKSCACCGTEPLPPLFGWRQISFFGKRLDCWRHVGSSSADLDSTVALAPILLSAVAWPIEWLIAWLSAGIA